jgi:hypothetical protein
LIRVNVRTAPGQLVPVHVLGREPWPSSIKRRSSGNPFLKTPTVFIEDLRKVRLRVLCLPTLRNERLEAFNEVHRRFRTYVQFVRINRGLTIVVIPVAHQDIIDQLRGPF